MLIAWRRRLRHSSCRSCLEPPVCRRCRRRDNRLVNWCCKLRTAVSDIEVDYIDVPKRTLLSVPGYGQDLVEFGVITSFAYPLEDGSGERSRAPVPAAAAAAARVAAPADFRPRTLSRRLRFPLTYPPRPAGEIVVATTRPETMLGDTAVAVHPEDPRYTHLHGKHVVHPVNQRRIPIICDAELVDMAFGTGASVAGGGGGGDVLPSVCIQRWGSGDCGGREPRQPRHRCTALVPLSCLAHALRPACLRPACLPAPHPHLHTHAGAVKITPAHDPNDFSTGKRHGLEFINVLDDNGNINTSEATGQFAGQPRFKVCVWMGGGVGRACVGVCEGGAVRRVCWVVVFESHIHTLTHAPALPLFVTPLPHHTHTTPSGARDSGGVPQGGGPVPRYRRQPHAPRPLLALQGRH